VNDQSDYRCALRRPVTRACASAAAARRRTLPRRADTPPRNRLRRTCRGSPRRTHTVSFAESGQFTPQAAAAATAADVHNLATRDAGNPVCPMRRFKRAPQQGELHPTGDTRRHGQSRRAPARVDPDQARQRQRAQISQSGSQRHADHRESQRRPCVAQSVVSGGIQPAESRCQQSHGRPGDDTPHVHGIGARELSVLKQRMQ
jgi:hypothetical protein